MIATSKDKELDFAEEVPSPTRTAATCSHQETVPGAVAIRGVDYVGDDGTVQIGGDEEAEQTAQEEPIATAQLVDTEEELRRREEHERIVRERDQYRQMIEKATLAEAVKAENDEEQGSHFHVREEHGDEESDNCISCSKKRLVILCGVLLVLAAIAVGLVFGLQSPSEPEDEQSLVGYLVSISPDGGEALHTPGLPQNKALDWLAGNENLETYSDDQKKQRYTLATIYYSTGGDAYWLDDDKWLDDGEECDRWWQDDFGGDPPVLRCSETGKVVELDLSSNNLKGTIPREIGLLSSSLEILDFGRNALYGTIPTEVGQLTNLTRLLLYRNDFSGSIPSEIGQLTKLTTLGLSRNNLTGTIPSIVQNMTNLLELVLYDNQFNGSFTCPDFIPDCFISCDQNGGDACRTL